MSGDVKLSVGVTASVKRAKELCEIDQLCRIVISTREWLPQGESRELLVTTSGIVCLI